MKRLLAALSVLIVLSLAGCTAAPAAFAGLTSLNRADVVPAQAAATPAPAAANLPAGIVELQDTLSDLYDAASPSVVNISVVMSAGSGMMLPEIPEHEGMPELPFNFSPDVSGVGSGFVWDRQGHIVTNNHVVDGATRIAVTFSDGLTVPAEIVGRDANSDLAVIKVDPDKVDTLRPVTVGDSTQVKVGQFAVAIGNPFGLEGTMTFGIVSALGRTLPVGNGSLLTGGTYSIPDIIQTDAPVNPGNSGGVLLDLSGRLIGVPTAIESSTRSSAGVGFAVPSVIVQKVVPVLIEDGKFEQPYIGIRGGTLTSAVAEAMGLPASTRGALVGEVVPDGPADKAGLRGSTGTVEIDGFETAIGGDVITAVDGQPIRDFEDLTTILARTGQVGQDMKLTVLRDGAIRTFTVTLAARPETQAPVTAQPILPQMPEAEEEEATPAPGAPAPGTPFLGVSGLTLVPELAEAMDLPEDTEGVLVVEVVDGSPAEEAGLQAGSDLFTFNRQRFLIGGDVITAFDGEPVATIDALIEAIQAKEVGDTATLTLLRDGEEQEVDVTLAARGMAQELPRRLVTPTPEPEKSAPAEPAPVEPPAAETERATGDAWLGLNGVSISADMAQMLGLGDQRGVIIVSVVRGSPAEDAGLRGVGMGFRQGRIFQADIVVAAGGEDVATMEDLTGVVESMAPGDELVLTVLRDGETEEVTVVLAERP